MSEPGTDDALARHALVTLVGSAGLAAAAELYGAFGKHPGDTYSELWWFFYRRAPRPLRLLMAGGLGAGLGYLWHHLCHGDPRQA